jgi:DNA polymerase-3 subunit gamma/tau
MYYTKYRPEKFADIIKPNAEVEAILNQITKGTIGHAYILSGSRGIGKTSTARLIAKGVNCLNFKDDVCGECENCIAIKNGGFVDVIEIDGASNRGIEEARSLRDSLKFAPLKGKKKVYIIDEVHMLTNEAFNALLKAIEEPPAYVLFILCTTEVHKIPETIKSRCQLFILKRPSNDQIIQKLKKIVNSEGLSVNDETLSELAIQANGGFRDAETMLTQIQGNPNLTLNVDSTDSKLEFLEKSLGGDYSSLIEHIGNLEKNGVNIVNWLASYLSLVRNVLHQKLEIKKNNNIFNQNQVEKVSKIISTSSVGELISHLNSFIEIYSKIRYSQTPELVFEVLLLNNFVSFTQTPKIIYSAKKVVPIEKNDKVAENTYSAENTEQNTEKLTSAEVLEVENSFEEVAEELVEEVEGDDFAGEIVISIDEVNQKWPDVIKTAGTENKTIETLLRVIRPKNTNNDIITFEVDFKFHAERMDNNKNKLIIEKILYTVFGRKLFYKCVIENKRKTNGFNEGESNNLTDYNVAPPKDLSPDDVLSIFDGGVPTK